MEMPSGLRPQLDLLHHMENAPSSYKSVYIWQFPCHSGEDGWSPPLPSLCGGTGHVRCHGRGPARLRSGTCVPALGEKQHHVQVHADGTSTPTPQTPKPPIPVLHPSYRAPLEQRKGPVRKRHVSLSPSPSHAPNSHESNPPCKNFPFPFHSAEQKITHEDTFPFLALRFLRLQILQRRR